MSTLPVAVMAWVLVLSMAAVWGITYALRYFVEPSAKSELPKLHGQIFIRKDHLTEIGCKLWLIRNSLILVALLLGVILWSLNVPAGN